MRLGADDKASLGLQLPSSKTPGDTLPTPLHILTRRISKKKKKDEGSRLPGAAKKKEVRIEAKTWITVLVDTVVEVATAGK